MDAAHGASAAIVFVSGIVGAACALCIRSDPVRIGVANMFSAGVFLGATLLHLLPDAAEARNDVEEAMFMCACGVCLTFFAAETVPYASCCWNSMCRKTRVVVDTGRTRRGDDKEYEMVVLTTAEDGEHDGHDHARDFERLARTTDSKAAYMLLFALSVHSFIAGIALGASPDPLAMFLAIVSHKFLAAFALGTAIVSAFSEPRSSGITAENKSVDSSDRDESLAMEFRSKFLKLVCIFSSVTPIGIVLGSALTSLTQNIADSAFPTKLEAMSSGTFLYVSLVEIASSEMAHSKQAHRLAKVLAFSVGVSLMALLAQWI